MPDFIYDTNPANVDGTTTFDVWADLLSAMQQQNGGSSILANGTNTIHLRCSSGLSATERLSFNGFTPSAANNVKIIGERSNDFPFVLTDADGTTETGLLSIHDDFVEVTSTGFGDAFIFAKKAETSARQLFTNYNNGTKLNGWILDGDGSTSVGGLYCVGDTEITNCLIMGCHRGFYGAIRASLGTTVDKATIYNCLSIRSVGPITNTLILKTDLSNTSQNDGLHQDCDNNAFDVDKTNVRYSGTEGDLNSFFGVAENAQTFPLQWGGVAIKGSSLLAGVASDGGAVGAFGYAPTPTALIVGPINRGQAFAIALNGHRAGVDVNVFIREKNGDGTEYPCTVSNYGHFEINVVAPSTSDMPAISIAECRIQPIVSM